MRFAFERRRFLGKAAEDYCATLFDTRYLVRNYRSAKNLPKEVFDALRENQIDYIFNFLSAVKVPIEAIEAVKKLAINFHPAPPDYPGRGCASFALFDNVMQYGATVHLMNEVYDLGEILSVINFPVLKDDYCDTLTDRALIYTLMLFYDVLYEIAVKGEIVPCNARWSRLASTRKEFDEWMTILPTDSEEEVQDKIKATRHRQFPGPYLETIGTEV